MLTGSSQLTRGTLGGSDIRAGLCRFIPACAGNSYERKKVTEYTSFNYEFKVFYKDEYVCDLLKIGRHEWAFSAFQSCDKLEGLQMFLYNKTSWETFKKKEEAIQHLENVLAAYESGERSA